MTSKRIYLFLCMILCFIIIFSGLASAQIVKQVDEFDNTKHAYSWFKDTDNINIKPLSQLLLKKTSRNGGNAEYLLIINRRDNFGGVSRYSYFSDFYIRFNGDTQKAFPLDQYGNQSSILGEQMALKLPQNVIDMILTNDKIELKIPLYTDTSKEIDLKNKICIIPTEVIQEWRTLIKG